MQEEKSSQEPPLVSLKDMSDFVGEVDSDINDLVRAVKEGKTDGVKELLDLGIDINGVDNHNFTPLQMAAKCGHYEIVELLLEKGAQVDKFKWFEKAEFDYSSDNRNEYNYCSLLPVQLAVKYDHIEVVKLLFSQIKESEFKEDDDNPDESLLMLAAENKNQEMIKTLYDIAYIKKFYLWNDYALEKYIEEGFIEGVRCLLDQGVDPLKRGGMDFSYMHNAVGNIPMMELLLSYSGDELLNEIDEGNQTDLLGHAIEQNEIQTAEWLMHEKGVQINENYNPIYHVLSSDNKKSLDQKLHILKFIDKCGFSLNRVDEEGFKPIHYAARYCAPAILEYLLNKGFDVNDITAPRGDSLLHLAVQKSNLEIVNYLISKGANINIKNSMGKLPIEAEYNDYYKDKACKIKKKLIIEGSDLSDLNNLFKEDWKKIVATCSLPEKFIVFTNLYYVIHNFDNSYVQGLKVIDKYKEIAYNKIIEKLNKNSWDRREQIKLIDEMLELFPKAKLFRWMEADMEKFADQLKARKEVLKTNDRDILEILSKSLKLVDSEVKHIEIIRESLSKEDQEIKNAYNAFMLNKGAFKEAEKRKKELIKLGPIRKRIEEVEQANKVLKSGTIDADIKKIKMQIDAEKIAIYQEELNFNPAAFNELFEIGTIKETEEAI